MIDPWFNNPGRVITRLDHTQSLVTSSDEADLQQLRRDIGRQTSPSVRLAFQTVTLPIVAGLVESQGSLDHLILHVIAETKAQVFQ